MKQRAPVRILKLIIVELILVGVSSIDICYRMNNTRAIEEVYGDQFYSDKEKEITVLSLNVNRMRTEGWAAKNVLLRDFILDLKAEVIALQETNVNWFKVPWKDRWEE